MDTAAEDDVVDTAAEDDIVDTEAEDDVAIFLALILISGVSNLLVNLRLRLSPQAHPLPSSSGLRHLPVASGQRWSNHHHSLLLRKYFVNFEVLSFDI